MDSAPFRGGPLFSNNKGKQLSTDKIKDHGYVVRWNKSFGFIRPDGGGQSNDVYVNFRHVKDRELAHGARVSYHLAPDWRDASKVMATEVEIVR